MKKIAIRVNNKREFDYLMNHFESKLWFMHSEINPDYPLIGYCRYETNYDEEYCDKANIQIIDFSTFAQIAGIEVVNEVVIHGDVIVNDKLITFKSCPFIMTTELLEEIYAAYKSLQ